MIDHVTFGRGVNRLLPGARYTLRGDQVEWLDDRPMPTLAEIAAASDDLAAPRIITPRAFRERLTLAEQAAIMQAAMADVDVLDWRLRAAEAQEIDLDHPETVAGLDFLISKGLLTAERRAAILA